MKKRYASILFLALVHCSSIVTQGAASIANETRPRVDSRAGNSVDTATGAFIQDLNLVSVQGARALDLNLSYNSLLVNRRGDVGYGWSHPYEARIEGNPAGVVTVYLNGNVGNQFRFVGVGQPYVPLNEQNRYDTLERFPSGEWKLRRLSGTTSFFDGAGRLLAIHDRNSRPILLERYDDGKLANISEPLTGRIIWFNYRQNVGSYLGLPLVSYITYSRAQSTFRFLQYDNRDRLSRIYDPVGMAIVGENLTSMGIPLSPNGVDYPITVTRSETNRLIRVFGDIIGAAPATLQVALISPGGRRVPLLPKAGDEQGVLFSINLFLDEFLGESLTGTWNLHVVDNANDGFAHTIRSLRIYASEEAANWTQYDYAPFPFNRISRATDGLGQRLYANTYDVQGRVAFQDDGRDDNGSWRFEYEDQPGGELITTVYDRTPFAHATRYGHDDDFHLLRVEDPLGHSTRFTHDPVTGDRLSITDARGNTTRFAYDAQGHVRFTLAPNGATTTFAHDPNGNLTKVTDALGFATTFVYDAFNNLESSTNALGFDQFKTYDQDGMLTFTVNKDGNGIEYGRTNGMLSSAQLVGAPDDEKETLEYDDLGRVIRMTDADGSASTIEYDSRGNILEKRNQLGHTISTRFDHRNRLISETDPEGNVTYYAYDGNGNTTFIIDPLSQVTQFKYDGEDQVIQVIGPAGRTTSTTYDPVGRVVQEMDELGNATSFTYDEVGNRTAVFGPAGVKVSETTYNELNAPVSHTDAHGNQTFFGYDVLGQRTSQTDARGFRTEFRVDPLNRVDRVIDPLGRQYQNLFLPDDALHRVRDAGGNETLFTYTPRNQVATITTPRGLVTTIEYTGNGHIARYLPPSLKAQEYTYNPAGRLERTKQLDPTVPDTVYAYDRTGNLTDISTQASSGGPLVRQISRTYDALNRQISNTDAQGNTVRHTYNAAGLVSQIIYPDAKTVTYTYDATRRLRTITDWAERVTEYVWNANNQITTIRFPNGTTRAMKYDDSDRLLSRTDFDIPGATIVSYRYAYDPNGFITHERLHADPVAYEPQATVFAYDDDNRLIQKDGVAITYDVDGNVTQGPVAGQSVSLEWDDHNNLVRTDQTFLSYDVEDRLTGWQVGNESVTLVVVQAASGSQILVNESSLGGTTRYVYGVGLAYEETNGQIRVHHHDERGNTVALSDSSGQVSGSMAYSPFGEIIHRSGDTGTLFQYGGLFGVVTAPNGLNYMRFRWYSPEIKRFISMDSSLGDIALPSSLNRYIYAGNNPVNFNDPEGEFWGVVVGAVAGSVIGAVTEVASSAIQGKPIDWDDVAAAAIGGAVQGALAGAGGPAWAVAGGALGSISENVSGALLKDQRIDPVVLAAGAAFGAYSGKLGSTLGKSSKAAQRAASNQWTKQGLKAAVQTEIGVFNKKGFSEVAGGVGKKFVSDYVRGTGVNVIRDDLRPRLERTRRGDLSPVSSKDGSGPSGRTGSIIQGATALPTVHIGNGGEYLHYQRYLDALSAADRPFPDTANRLSSF